MKAAEANFLKFLKRSETLRFRSTSGRTAGREPECLQLWSDIVRASHERRRGPLHRLDRLHRHRHLPGHRRQRDRGHRRPAAADDDLAAAAGAGARARGGRRGVGRDGAQAHQGLPAPGGGRGPRGRGALQAAADQGRPRHVHAPDRRPRDRPVGRRRGWSTPTTCSSSSCGGRPCRSSQVLAGVEKLLDRRHRARARPRQPAADLREPELDRARPLAGRPDPQLRPDGAAAEAAGGDLHQLLVPARAVVPGRAPGPVRPLHARLPDDEDGPDPEDRPRLRELQGARAGERALDAPSSSPTSTTTRRTGCKLAFDRADDPALREAIADLNQLKVDVAYPVPHGGPGRPRPGQDHATPSCVEVVRLVESYVFRRAIAGIPTNILNKTFAALAREIDKDELHGEPQGGAAAQGVVRADADRRGVPARVRGQGRLQLPPPQLPAAQAREPRPQGAGRRRQLHDRARHAAEPGPVAGVAGGARARLEDGPGAVAAHDRQPDPDRLQLRAERPAVQREADDEGRLPRQPAAAEPVPGQARALERGGDPEARRAARRPGAQDLAGAEAARGDAGEVPQDQGQGRRRLHARRPPGARRGRSARSSTSCASASINLDAGVREEVRKQYIAYKLATNFVEVVPLASELKLYLDITIEELERPARTRPRRHAASATGAPAASRCASRASTSSRT